MTLWCSRPRGRTLGCLHSGGRERHRRRLWLPARLRLRHGPSAPSRCCDWLWPIVEIRRRTSWVSAAVSGPAQDAGAFLLRFWHSQIRCNQAYPHRHRVYFAIPGGRLDFLRARPSTSPPLPPGPSRPHHLHCPAASRLGSTITASAALLGESVSTALVGVTVTVTVTVTRSRTVTRHTGAAGRALRRAGVGML